MNNIDHDELPQLPIKTARDTVDSEEDDGWYSYRLEASTPAKVLIK